MKRYAVAQVKYVYVPNYYYGILLFLYMYVLLNNTLNR